MAKYYPIFLNIQDKKCVVVGGGNVAWRKVCSLKEAGARVTVAGLVLVRQRPGTAKGVIFVTLEDETGHVNLIVWQGVAERQRSTLLQARLMGVWGEVQREGDVLHVIAGCLEDYSGLLGGIVAPSRDFH